MIKTYSFGEFLSSYILLMCSDNKKHKINIDELYDIKVDIEKKDFGTRIDFSSDSQFSCFCQMEKGIFQLNGIIYVDNIQECMFYISRHNSDVLLEKLKEVIKK